MEKDNNALRHTVPHCTTGRIYCPSCPTSEPREPALQKAALRNIHGICNHWLPLSYLNLRFFTHLFFPTPKRYGWCPLTFAPLTNTTTFYVKLGKSRTHMRMVLQANVPTYKFTGYSIRRHVGSVYYTAPSNQLAKIAFPGSPWTFREVLQAPAIAQYKGYPWYSIPFKGSCCARWR